MSFNKKYSNTGATVFVFGEDDPAAIEAARVAAQAQATADAITAAVADATKGLKAKNDELLGKVVEAKNLVKQFEGLDPVALKGLKDRLDQDEDAKLLAEGKKHLVVEKYTERMRAAHAEELKALQLKVQEEAARADTYKGSVLDNQIRSVCKDLHPGAVEDAILYARQIFQLDAKGKAVQLDTEGRPVLGKDGASPFSPAEWIEMQKDIKPHWFPMSTSGAGAGGSRDASGVGKTIKRADFDKLSGPDQAKVSRTTKIVD
jgi:hypothetical protein